MVRAAAAQAQALGGQKASFVRKLIRESLDIRAPQVKIEARMEILDRSAYEGIGVQWGGAGAGALARISHMSAFRPSGGVTSTAQRIYQTVGGGCDPEEDEQQRAYSN